jgi:CheY-like chemotaxis protein
MAHGIIKQHQGWIEVVTLHGVGTSFKIFLPANPHPPCADAVEPRAGTLPGGNERILLAETDAAMRLLTRRLLETFGYEVLEAASGREALEMSEDETHQIDLLLVSLVLPDGVTGPDLAERLRKQWPELRAIFVSSHGLDLFPPSPGFLQRPGNCFLQKPCASPVLLSTVRRCLDEAVARPVPLSIMS